MRNIRQIKNIRGKRILLRVDFNVPIKNGKVEDDFRIQKALPTIQYLQKKGAKIILLAHLGKGEDSLLPVAKTLQKYIKVKFVPDIVGIKVTNAVENMKNGEILLLENLRMEAWEQAGDKHFAEALAQWGDIYVNEAFSVSHRKDVSIVLLPKLLPHYAGLQLEEEVRNLSRAFKNPKHPFLFILGGAKFSTKTPLINKYLKLADVVFIGGALANDFLKARGYEIGASLTSDTNYGIEKLLKNKKLILPTDVIVASGNKLIHRRVGEIQKDEVILDIGSASAESLTSVIKKSKLILWNGPLGKYEAGGGNSTKKILKLIAVSKAETIIGGGDTVALISKMKMEKKFSFISTGGGATLDFLANGTLPGIQAFT